MLCCPHPCTAQTPDEWTQLNRAFFRQNGECGLVLKPVWLRGGAAGSTYSPLPVILPASCALISSTVGVELLAGAGLQPHAATRVKLTVSGHPVDQVKCSLSVHLYSFHDIPEGVGVGEQ